MLLVNMQILKFRLKRIWRKRLNNLICYISSCLWAFLANRCSTFVLHFKKVGKWDIEISGFTILVTLLNPINPRREGRSFLPPANLNLNYFWTACDMNLTLTRDYFNEKKLKYIKFSESNIFLYHGYCQKIEVRICRNSFSHRNKCAHV